MNGAVIILDNIVIRLEGVVAILCNIKSYQYILNSIKITKYMSTNNVTSTIIHNMLEGVSIATNHVDI